MKSKATLLFSLCAILALLAGALGIQPAQAQEAVTWTVNAALANDDNCTAATRQCKTIQAAINAAAGGDIINILAGTYVENLIVTKPLTIRGAGQGRTIIYPAISNPNCGGAGGGSLCTDASHIILVQANNVNISMMTLDGNNPHLTATPPATGGGVDLDARNGIITNHGLGVYNNLEISHVTVKNIYLRGIYASSGGTFNFHHNRVQNVQGENASIGIFNFYGSGVIAFNHVTDANDAISANWSSGTQFLNNTVERSGSGVHTDNNGGSGGTADTIAFNTVQDCSPNGYGVWGFAAYRAIRFEGNIVKNCAVGLTQAGVSAAVTPVFVNNVVDGQSLAGSTGIYVTTSMFGWGNEAVSALFEGNQIINVDTGIYVEQTGGFNPSPVFHHNSISGSLTQGAAVSDDFTADDIDATMNWWGSATGPCPAAPCSGEVVDTDHYNVNPFASALVTGPTASVHEVGQTGTLTTRVTAANLFGVQFMLNHDPAVLAFVSGTKTNAGTSPTDWDWNVALTAYDFTHPAAGQTLLLSALNGSVHPSPANLTNGDLATWTYQCSAPGTSSLLYDQTSGTGSLLSDKDGGVINAAWLGGQITCVQRASVNGVIQLQGRRSDAAAPAGWNGAVVTLTCASPACAGSGPYVLNPTDSQGHYDLTKTDLGTGITLGDYTAAVTRRGYLPATYAGLVTIAAGTTSISPNPTLLGGDVNGDQLVEVDDLTAVGGAFGTLATPDTGADLNGDGFVNIFDLVMIGSNYGKTASLW